MLSCLPVVLRRYFHIVLHIMGVFVLIKIQAILFGKRLLYGITNKQKGKIEAFFFVGRSRGIRAKYSFIVTKADRYRSPPKTKFAVKSLEQSADLSFVDGSFIIKKFTDGWINIHAVTPLKIINWKNYMPSFMAFDLKAPTDRSRSDCVHEQVAKRIWNVRFTDRQKNRCCNLQHL